MLCYDGLGEINTLWQYELKMLRLVMSPNQGLVFLLDLFRQLGDLCLKSTSPDKCDAAMAIIAFL
jgi:hypothetical protein